MRKYKILISCMLCLVLSFSMVTPTFALGRQPIKPMAWPGRPDGNGDGSEEYLIGEKGQPNGPYHLISTSSGTVASLKDVEELEIFLATTIVDACLTYITFGSVKFITTAGRAVLSQLGQSGLGFLKDKMFKNVKNIGFYRNFEGNYYKVEVWLSGRSSKLVYHTYLDEQHQHYVQTYSQTFGW